jgi:hypothetical protein
LTGKGFRVENKFMNVVRMSLKSFFIIIKMVL